MIFHLAFLYSAPAEAKKRCRPLLDKLQNIQALQRNGYSLKKGQSLRAREEKARDKWWQCERSSSFKKSKQRKKTKGSNNQKTKKKKNINYQAGKIQKITAKAPFANNQEITLKSKYEREKRFAWLAYYQAPKRCHFPKDIKTFAFCSEDKLAQQQSFERQYLASKVAKSETN